MENRQRRTWAEIDLDCIAHNFGLIQKAAGTRVCCVIKADGYGHGAVRLAREYEALGADFFGVSNIDEALQLRRGGICLPILIFGYTPPPDAAILAANGISQAVYSTEYGRALSDCAAAAGVQVKIHVKIDTGMSRLGFYFQRPDRDIGAVEEVAALCRLPGFEPEGIFTHFAVADEGDNAQSRSFTLQQSACFGQMIERLGRAGLHFAYCHAANSGATLDFPETHMNMVRAGIILYGLAPSDAVCTRLPLRPALALKSVVSHIKFIEAGSSVSYGRDFTAAHAMCIATVPIGYADGYTRILADAGAQLLIRGRRCKIVGRVCMDQLMVDLGDLTAVRIGDPVTVIGRDGEEEITAEEIAQKRGTINYEVICDIGARVPRIYLKGGKEVGALNYIGL